MKILGFQKLSLLDYPEKVACVIFTGGCNFCCPFCHNASLVNQKVDCIDENEIFDYLIKRKKMLDGVCITGGEPLLQKDIEVFIKKIKALGFLVKLDTNGSFPNKLKNLVENKLVDYVAMDIKNCKDKYAQTCGVKNMRLDNIEESVNYLLNGKVEYEFRTTIVKDFHTKQDILKIAQSIKKAKKYYLQGFVDSGDVILQGLSGYTSSELLDIEKEVKKINKNFILRGV